VIPVDRLYSKYECVIELFEPGLLSHFNFESHLNLFLDAVTHSGAEGVHEREVDYVNDLMMYDLDRVIAERILHRFKMVTKSLIERTCGLRVHHLEPGWNFLNRRKDAIVLIAYT
jgi:hypothetical protein